MSIKNFKKKNKIRHQSQIECSYCKKIFIPTILLDLCHNHFCDECVNFWLSNVLSSQIISAEEVYFVQKVN